MDRKTELGKFIHKANYQILGKDYSISFAFIDDERMKELNKQYRKINKTTDILSFSLSETEGEIVISKKETARKAKDFFMKYNEYLRYLIIHGLLHLKGMDHGSKMEGKEKEFCKKLKVRVPDFLLLNDQTNNSRNRYRNARSAGNSRNSGTRKRVS